MTDWQIIKAEFINGCTLKELSEKYNIPFETIKSRHRQENWSLARKEYKRQLDESTTKKLVEKQATKIAAEADQIQGIIDKLLPLLDEIPANSKEGLLRVINELWRTKGLYTGKTTKEQNNEEGSGGLKISANDIYIALIRKDPAAIRKIGGNPDILREDPEVPE